MPYRINQSKCIKCETCVSNCPMACISKNDQGQIIIDENVCIGCGACRMSCPVEAPEEV